MDDNVLSGAEEEVASLPLEPAEVDLESRQAGVCSLITPISCGNGVCCPLGSICVAAGTSGGTACAGAVPLPGIGTVTVPGLGTGAYISLWSPSRRCRLPGRYSIDSYISLTANSYQPLSLKCPRSRSQHHLHQLPPQQRPLPLPRPLPPRPRPPRPPRQLLHLPRHHLLHYPLYQYLYS